MIYSYVTERLSTSTYLGSQSIAMTVCLIILIMEGSIINNEYKYIKREIDRRTINEEEFIPFVNGADSLTIKPTAVWYTFQIYQLLSNKFMNTFFSY